MISLIIIVEFLLFSLNICGEDSKKFGNFLYVFNYLLIRGIFLNKIMKKKKKNFLFNGNKILEPAKDLRINF